MIKIYKLNDSEPYNLFNELYQKALCKDEKQIEAISISSFSKSLNQVDSRYVNLKYIDDEEWIFFSNYSSPKAKQFSEHDQISAVLLWKSINVQIRILANIKHTSRLKSDEHFSKRSQSKNALAISSDQSKQIGSYDKVLINYEKTLHGDKDLNTRPSYWGGFSFKPYSIEFWEGKPNRLNKRILFKKIDKTKGWKKNYLQP